MRSSRHDPITAISPPPVPPVSITKIDSTAEITSFQAEVKTFEEHNRRPGSKKETGNYRLSMKIIDGDLYSRMDFPADEKGVARVVIGSPDEIVIYDDATKRIEYRAKNPNEEAEDLSLRTLFAKADIAEMYDNLKRLQYRISEDPENGLERFETPSALLSDLAYGSESVLSNSVLFDIKLGAPVEFDSVKIDEEGTTLRTVQNIQYREIDGVPVKVGETMTLSYDFPYTIDVSDRILPSVGTDQTIPQISLEELAALEEQGARIFYHNEMAGDPADPDYSITTTTVYGEVVLNAATDSLFRVAF